MEELKKCYDAITIAWKFLKKWYGENIMDSDLFVRFCREYDSIARKYSKDSFERKLFRLILDELDTHWTEKEEI